MMGPNGELEHFYKICSEGKQYVPIWANQSLKQPALGSLKLAWLIVGQSGPTQGYLDFLEPT